MKFRILVEAGGKMMAAVEEIVLAVEKLLMPARDQLRARIYTHFPETRTDFLGQPYSPEDMKRQRRLQHPVGWLKILRRLLIL